jgi:hypothetical protein
MVTLKKVIFLLGILSLLSACAYEAPSGRYYNSTNNEYGQGYRQPSYGGYQDYGYSNNRHSGYQQPNYGYTGYQRPPYGYGGNQQPRYCPDEDND